MPTYVCSKCARVFKRKSGYDDHISKKNDCAQNTALDVVIETKVKEAVRAIQPNGEITKENLPTFFEDLHHLLWYRAGLSPERALDHMTFFFAYRLIEQQADALNLPQECRWSYIASIPNENDLFEAIKKGVVEFRKRPKTKAFFKQHEIQKADIVFEIVRHINRISLTTLGETDVLGDIFEYMLSRGMSTMADEGQYFTNRQICKLAFKLAYDIKQTVCRADGSLCTFADWFCGTGGFPAEYVKGVEKHVPDIDWKKNTGAIYCQDMNLSSVTTTLLNLLILTGVPFSSDTIRNSNSFSDPITIGSDAPFPGIGIDYEFMNPPYGGDKSKGKEYKFAYARDVKGTDGRKTKKFFVNQDIQSIGIEDDDKVSAGVQLAMATLSNDGGVCCIVLPQGFFFGTSKKAIELRKKIAEEYKIHSVVDIASGAFVNTGTKTSMLVFQRGVGPTETVKFLDTNETVLVEATLDALREKNYSLAYKQYLAQDTAKVDGFELVKLKDILQFQKKPGHLGRVDGNESGKFPFYTCAQKKLFVDVCEFDKLCVIVNRGGQMNVRIDKNFSISHDDIHVLSCDQEITTKYVGYYLKTNMVVLENGMNGTTLKHLNKSYLEEVTIPLPSFEVQTQIVEAIDGWMNLARHEEEAVKLLENQIVLSVQDLGRYRSRVKLGDVLMPVKGKRYPVSEGNDVGKYPLLRSSKDGKVKWMDDYTYEGPFITVGNGGEANFRLVEKFNASTHTLVYDVVDSSSKEFVYYSILSMRDKIGELCFQGTGLENLNITLFMDMQISVPPLADQQTLQPEFDEIRNKREKILHYKSKANDAIRRFIPV